MWELDHEEGWALKNWCFWAVVLEKILESPLDSKEIKPVNLKGNQPWIFIGRGCWDAEAPILWPPDAKSQLFFNTLDKILMLGKTEGGDGLDGWMASMIQWTWVWANSWRQWRTGMPGVLQSMGLQKSQTQLSDWAYMVTCDLWCYYYDSLKVQMMVSSFLAIKYF